MNPAKVIAVTVLAGGISIGTAIFGERWLAEHRPDVVKSDADTAQIQSLPDFELSDLAGRRIQSRAWAGKVLVINYWASWCPECVDEMPMMIRAQQALRERGVQFVGIALDREEDVKEFLVTHPVNYPIVLATAQVVDLSKRLGNRLLALPFTVIFDSRGRRVTSQMGEIGADRLKATLDELIGPPPPGDEPPQQVPGESGAAS